MKFPRRKQNPFDYVLTACGNEAAQHQAGELTRNRGSRHQQFILYSLFTSCCRCFNQVILGRISKMELIALRERERLEGFDDLKASEGCGVLFINLYL